MIETRRDTLPELGFASHEHHELRRGLDRIHDVGSLREANDDLSAATREVLHWVDAVLEPHSHWEDSWLYPEFDERAGTPWATKLMSFEHQQIRDAALALATARTTLRQARTQAAAMEVRARLFGLEAIIRAHMAREERFLIPLLETDTSGAGAGASGWGDRPPGPSADDQSDRRRTPPAIAKRKDA